MAIAEIAMDGSLYDFLFKQILGLSRCTGIGKYQFGCVTGEFAHDFIFGLFLPHIIILIFLFLFSNWAHLRQNHAGLSTLLGIAAYVFIIYMGWYPIIAVWSIYWLALGIVFSFFNFLWSRVIHPTKQAQLMDAAKNLGGKLGESSAKNKKIRLLRRREQRLQRRINDPSVSDTRKQHLEMRLEEIKEKIEDLRYS